MLLAPPGSDFQDAGSTRWGGALGTRNSELGALLDAARSQLTAAGLNPPSIEAELRYQWITGVVQRTVTHASFRRARSTTDRVDAVLLHRVWGPLIFVAVMALMFQAIFAWAQPLMDA